MAIRPPRSSQPELTETALRLIGRFFFGTTGVMAAAVAVLLLVAKPPGVGAEPQLALPACLLALAAVCGLAVRRSERERFPMHAVLMGVSVGVIALAGGMGLALHDGIRNPALGFCALVVCTITAITSFRHGLALRVLTITELLALALAEATGLRPTPEGAMPWLLALALQKLIVVSALIAGTLIAKVLRHYLHAAAEREQRFAGLLGIAADWYWEQDTAFRFTHIAESVENACAIPPAQRLGHAPWETSALGLTEAQLDAHRADLEAHRAFSGLLTRHRGADGRWRVQSLSGEPKFDAQGAFSGYWGVARDVTQELRTQRAVAASETRYRELFTRSPSPLLLHRRGLIFDANEAAARLFGFADAAAMNGFAVIDLFPGGDSRERALERVAQLEALPVGEGLPVADFQARTVDGQAVFVQGTAVRVETATGLATLSIFFDITKRKAVEAALRRSEAMLSHLFATSPEGITLNEMASGRYAMVNEAFCDLTGYEADEVVGRTPAELALWRDPADMKRLVALLEHGGAAVDMPAELIAKSGATVSVLLSAGRFVMDRHDYVVVNARDVTASERTRLEHAAILERASIGIAFTRNNLFVQANPCFERMFGWAPGTLAGQPGEVVWPDAKAYADIGAMAGPLLAKGESFSMECRMARRDGSEFWCRLLGQVVDRNHPADGGTIWIADDVTERRRLDQALAAARDAAEAASRAKSAFLANTSHEIRTPLNGLLGLARLAMQPELDAERRQRYLDQIFDSAQSLAGIISDILDVSKIEAGKITLDDVAFSLPDLLQAVHHAYHALAEAKDLALALVIDESLPGTVRGDPHRLRQILSNFITNALKFTERGSVRLEATSVAASATVSATPSAPSAGWTRVRLTVTDTGPGIDAAMQGRLFTAFSQGDSSITRRHGGAGLGLSICRELAQLMGGEVGMDTREGHGSTFWAELPLQHALPALPPPGTDVRDAERLRGARVLLVEDNPVNMMISVAMLEHWGVRVSQALDGQMAIAAVDAAHAAGDAFEAVLMDVQMPVMSGHEAARELRQRYPASELPIIALTAAALVSERDAAMQSGMNDFLTKPIDSPHLREALAKHVTRRGQTGPA
ncbi:hypothetical protein BH11PSE9_BH11PSE9_29820 [soil metagenome]